MKAIWLILLAIPALGQNCTPTAVLPLGGSLSGVLTSAGCPLPDGTKSISFSLVVHTRGTLQLTAKSSDFAPWLLIRDPEGRKVASGTAVLQHYMEAGAYRVLLNGPAEGKFTLTSVFTPEPNVLCTAFNKLGTGQSISGNLTASSCRLPDGSAFDEWQTTVYGAGILTISMQSASVDSLLVLRGEIGNPIAMDDNGGGGRDALISVPVSGRETYSILASASGSKLGAYQLSASFTPNDDETCRPVRTLTDSIQLSGSISAASCNFNLPERQDSSLFNIYSLHVEEVGTARISVPDSTFTPLLLLLDANGNPLVEDSESGGLYVPLIRQTLPAGDYSLLVFNEDSFDGDYSLQYTFTPGASPPCGVIPLDNGQTSGGTLNGDTSCRASELLFDKYRFVLPSSSTVDLGLSSSDFTTFLELHDAQDNLLSYGDSSTDGSSAHLQADLAAGTYFLTAASADLPGNYSLNVQFKPKDIPACATVTTLPLNTGFYGNLGPGSCAGPAGEPVEYFKFTLAADGTVALVMSSVNADSYLILTDASGNVLRADDNSYADSDALIVQYLRAGTYRVEARGRNIINTGRYRVDLLWTGGAKAEFCAAVPFNLGSIKSSALTYTGCQYYDNTFADIYQIKVVDSSKPVDIQLSSSDFDSYLILMDAKGNTVAFDDNSGGRTDARITVLLDPAVYYVVAKPSGDPKESGSYQIAVKQ